MKDSTDLLKAEIAKEEAHLADEKKSLQEMEKNAKRAESDRKRQSQNVRDAIRCTLDQRDTLADNVSGTPRAAKARSTPPVRGSSGF